MKLINVRITHKRASVSILESVTFRNPSEVLKKVKSIRGVKECLLLQTCNRVEFFVISSKRYWMQVLDKLIHFWKSESSLSKEKFDEVLEKDFNYDAVRHLFYTASGIESMIVGEEQILGQINRAYLQAEEAGTVGPYLKKIFHEAVKVGSKVRRLTEISRGSVSIGSVAVHLIEEVLGTLEDKKGIIIGAGEMGELVGKALAKRKRPIIFVANRTYERGVKLARILGGEAVRFDRIRDLLKEVDFVIVATSAPHYVLTEEMIKKAMEERNWRNLLIIDLSQPRNVDERVANIQGVKLLNLDGFRRIAELNMKARMESIEKVKELVEKELEAFKAKIRREGAEQLISAIFKIADEARRKELQKALELIGNLKEEQRKVIEDMSYSIVEGVLRELASALRKAAEAGDKHFLKIAGKLFGLEKICHFQEFD